MGLAHTPVVPDLLLRWAAVAAGEALLLAGRPDAATVGIGTGAGSPGIISAWERAVLARARFALGELPAVESLLHPLLRVDAPHREPAITGWLLQALIAARQHRDGSAFAALTTAVDLAQPDTIRRPFLLIGDAIPDLLMRFRQFAGRHERFVADLLERLVPQPSTRTAPILMGHLTERELNVLHYLPTMLKAAEIGDILHVSVNTVKAHLRSIYRKLGADSRRDAVDKARATGLL